MSYNTLYFDLKLPINYPIFCSEYACSPDFGPSIEMSTQDCGQLGRNGKLCSCYIMCNGLLTVHYDAKVRELIQSKDCQ